jgi:hypothetical protein
MNIIYETTKERGATILMPTAMVDSMNPGGVMGLTSFAMDAQKERRPSDPAAPAAAPAVPNVRARRQAKTGGARK